MTYIIQLDLRPRRGEDPVTGYLRRVRREVQDALGTNPHSPGVHLVPQGVTVRLIISRDTIRQYVTPLLIDLLPALDYELVVDSVSTGREWAHHASQRERA